ncbi:heavy-metal-associated domain-containing protein [Ornithinicoccus halotolerans]|uniref:heavy-metal-associated domain-containing protein n=1 Tax=Ornithinicoccus halotolerans TaxID=1748220 RepID=UPI001297CDC7|nr:heavy-metal-associated domain-containing protein [Ornithinicoccus halotolerans]
MNQTQTTELTVTGMNCGHCVSSVTEELSEVEGVRSVRVDLNKDGASPVYVDSEGPLDLEAAKAAVAEAGYTVTS